jgi:tetratricopeptide (TPR) repeat protein
LLDNRSVLTDPLPTEGVQPQGPLDDTDREARIEQLLLSGLDHYFAGQYEHAINVWTRVIFLERHHDRAHAYIERARSALAERQRETDELLHTGVDAYNAGDIDKARDFLARAADRGSDTAQVFLDRLHRVAVPPLTLEPHREPSSVAPSTRRRRLPGAPNRSGWLAAGVAAAAVAAVMLVGGLPLGNWLSDVQEAPAISQTPLAEPLPIVRASELALIRARSLYEGGRLRDALRTLDRVDPADPSAAEADRLRGEIQRDLLTDAAGTRP